MIFFLSNFISIATLLFCDFIFLGKDRHFLSNNLFMLCKLRGEKRNVSICGGPENDRLLWLSKRYGGVGESGLEKRSVYIALHWAYI